MAQNQPQTFRTFRAYSQALFHQLAPTGDGGYSHPAESSDFVRGPSGYRWLLTHNHENI